MSDPAHLIPLSRLVSPIPHSFDAFYIFLDELLLAISISLFIVFQFLVVVDKFNLLSKKLLDSFVLP